MKWKKNEGNEVLVSEDFHISYNPNTGNSLMGSTFTNLGNAMGAEEITGRPLKDGEETALCYDGRFDILEGDFRKEYEKAFPKGLSACKKVYEKHKKEHGSNWSTDCDGD